MFRYVGRMVVACAVFVGFSLAGSENYSIKDNRDGKSYKVIASGNLNWFDDNLAFQKKVAYRDKRNVSYYKKADWTAACPVGTHVPDVREWTAFAKDRFTGPRKLQNVKSFADKTRGFYDIGLGVMKIQGKDAAYFAVSEADDVRAMMLDTKRGNAKIVSLPENAVVTVRCVSERNLYAERFVDSTKMVLTDPRDKQQYKVDFRGNRLWMLSNLKFGISSPDQCLLGDAKFCKQFGRFYSHSEAKKVCPEGWHLPDDGEWRDFQKDRSKLDWNDMGRGGCRDWDGFCNSEFTGHYWSSTSIKKNTGRSWEFRRQGKSIDRTDQSVQKGLYVRCVAELE